MNHLLEMGMLSRHSLRSFTIFATSLLEFHTSSRISSLAFSLVTLVTLGPVSLEYISEIIII
jgi:hypothetical protein